MSDYLDGLNQAQREAVETTEGPLLVLAGAGTGKTRVLTTRFAHILISRRAFPNQILTVTFTNKAAREMRERVAKIMGGPVEGLWLGTFHALSARMLRRWAERVGLTSSFSILDTDDQLRLLKQILEAARVDFKRWPPNALMAQIQRWKDKGFLPDQIPASESSDYANGRAEEFYAAYQARLRQLNAVDFGDLLLLTVHLLKTDPEILAHYHRAFRYILVDEYQDTNLVQYYWLRLLAQGHKNICCVGDDDQSIYSWRGAEIENILKFERDFPGAKIVRLEANYRSTAPILNAASHLIAHNEGRLGKTLHPGRNDAQGEKVEVISLWDSEEEARTAGSRIESLWRSGHSLNEIAILVRAGFQTRAFEERLLTLGVPYRIVGGLRFYERQEIRDAIAYLRVLAQPADDLAFERIVNLPKRGVGESALRNLHETARAANISLHDAMLKLVAEGGFKGKLGATLRGLSEQFEAWRDLLAAQGPVAALDAVLEESGYIAMWKADKSPDAPGRLENLKELSRALADFETLAQFLEHVALVTEAEEQSDGAKVSMMTLHGAKGLEFDTVFLPGWEEGVFPNQRSLDEGGNKSLEEERRLAYVGITRARQRAIILHAANRRIYANWQSSIPSRFINELPEDVIRRSGSAQPQNARMAPAATQFPVQARRPDSWEVQARPARATKIPVGARVFHQKFGYGRVIAADDDRLDIDFETSGEKRVLDRFVERQDG
ncbi:MAG: UvrD-helicase domain-containing protein [Proteobacteria bacterium]|nr:UvrD-helicase domain-containing protein [Pseudomonadota bacterium]MBU6426232.1 UvrD-helicase domain-containing protein [Rhodospirillales bacterium]